MCGVPSFGSWMSVAPTTPSLEPFFPCLENPYLLWEQSLPQGSVSLKLGQAQLLPDPLPSLPWDQGQGRDPEDQESWRGCSIPGRQTKHTHGPRVAH